MRTGGIAAGDIGVGGGGRGEGGGGRGEGEDRREGHPVPTTTVPALATMNIHI